MSKRKYFLSRILEVHIILVSQSIHDAENIHWVILGKQELFFTSYLKSISVIYLYLQL